MAQKTRKTKSASLRKPRRPLLMAVFILVIISGCLLAKVLWQASAGAAQAEATAVAQVLATAAGSLKADVPVDPKTGDLYFPEAKLYLPAPSEMKQLTYAHDPNGNDGEELSVSTKHVFNQNAAKLYTASNHEKMLELLPRLQACQRGIKLLYQQTSKDTVSQLKETVHLNNGKTLYIYLEKQCPDLNSTVELLKHIRAY